MKYKVIEKTTGKETGPYCIVTQNGEVAWWDEGQGWEIDENQERYEIIVCELNELHKDIIKLEQRIKIKDAALREPEGFHSSHEKRQEALRS